jgi:microcystin-dependent protein
LAAKPAAAQMAWADDTGNVFTYDPTSSAWTVLNNGFDDPLPIGAIADFPSRIIPNGWLECDGSAIPADAKFNALRTLLGTANLPDLRGLFSRAARPGETLLTKVDWTTGAPKTVFGTTNDGNHSHSFKRSNNNFSGDGKYRDSQLSTVDASGGGTATGGGIVSAGSHTHAITGGDAETAPDHVRLVRCIKAFHITLAKPAPDQLMTALVAPTGGQALIFDAATSSWKNGSVPKITYSTTAPLAPNLGDLWYDSNNNRKLLNVWNGTAWLGTTGFGVGVAGSAVQLPGYFNQDPSDTAAPADTGGLSFRYYSGQTQLFLNKGSAWNAVTPMLGNPANAGSTAVADAAGKMAWLSEPRFARSSADLGTSGTHMITLAKPATQMIEMWGFVMNADHFRAIPRMVVGNATTNAVWDFSSTTANTRMQALSQYRVNGVDVHDNTYFSTHQAGFCYKGVADYPVKGAMPLTFTLKITHMAANYWFFDLESKFTSSDTTPMIHTANWMSEGISASGIYQIGVETRAWNSDTVVPSHHSINVRYL